MEYKILFTYRALKDLEKIDTETKIRIGEKLKEYSKDPLKYAKKLSNPIIGSYRFRIGDYRVIFDIDGEKIDILRIGHRRNTNKKGIGNTSLLLKLLY